MTLGDILEQLRSLYTDEFSNRAQGFPDDMAQVLAPEALYCEPDGQPLRTGALKLPARGDLCVRHGNKVTEVARVDAARSLTFEPFRFVWNEQVQVALHPFPWNDCRVCIPEPIEAVALKPLITWLEDAMRLEVPAGSAAQLLGAVHGMTVPRSAADGTRFEIDFGSAPVSAFEALLVALARARVGLVVLGRG